MRRQTYRRVFLQHLKQILQDLESVRMIQPEDLGLLELKRAVRNKVARIGGTLRESSDPKSV